MLDIYIVFIYNIRALVYTQLIKSAESRTTSTVKLTGPLDTYITQHQKVMYSLS